MFGITDQATIIAAGVNLFLTFYVLFKFRGWNRALNRYFAVLSSGFALWNLGVATHSSLLIYTGVFMLPPAFYMFVLALLRQLNRRQRTISGFLGFICGVMILTGLWGLNQEPVSVGFRLMLNLLAFALSAPVWFYSMGRLLNRYRSTRFQQERSRLLFVLTGSASAGIAGITAGLTTAGYRLESWTAIAGLIYTVLITVAIMRHRLFDVGRFISRLTVVTILSLILWSLFGFLGRFQIDEQSITFVSVFVAALIVVMLYEPLKTFIEGQAHRVQSPETLALLKSLDQFSEKMNSQIDELSLIRVFCDHLEQSGRMSAFSIHTADSTMKLMVLRDGMNLHQSRGTSSTLPDLLVETLIQKRAPISRNQLHIELRSGLPRHLQDNKMQLYRIMNRLKASVIFPFIASDKLYGFVTLSFEDPEAELTRSEEDALNVITRQFASALAHVRLEELNRTREHLVALGRLASGLAHEIRNPLATIKAGVQYLEPESFPEDVREFLLIIRDEVDRLDRFVNRFLDYARPVSGNTEQPVINLVSLIERITRIYSDRYRESGIEFDANISDIQQLNLMVPEDAWTQIFENLLSNAAHAVDSNGVIRITGAASHQKSMMHISVEDSGSGIPEDQWPFVFEPFYSKRKGGTGLGLAIVHRLVTRMNGQINCSHSPIGGACFIISVPLL